MKLPMTLVLVIVAGCGPEETGPDSASATFSREFQQALVDPPNLLARVALSPTHAFEFYEIGRGNLAFSEVGANTESPTDRLRQDDIDHVHPAALFARLAPGRDMPPKLQRFLAGHSTKDGPPAPTGQTRQALSSRSRSGGTPGGSCPSSLFPSISGPLGAFCPTWGNDYWCWTDIDWAYVDHSHERTRDALATVCTDWGQAELKVQVFAAITNGQQIDGDDFFVPEGMWRQWRSSGGCSGLIFRTCDNFGIKFDVPVMWDGGWTQFGGAWKRW
jgi:hypothetical protein